MVTAIFEGKKGEKFPSYAHLKAAALRFAKSWAFRKAPAFYMKGRPTRLKGFLYDVVWSGQPPTPARPYRGSLQMEQAVEDDDKATQAEPPRPALAKVSLLAEVEAMLRKKQYHEVMIDEAMLSTLARWLRPTPDGSLVSLMVRKALLSHLMRFEIDETILGSLRSSGIGKYVKLLTLHKKETPENRKVAIALIEKWSRPIFATSAKVRAEELPVASRPISYGELPKERAEEEGAIPTMDRKTANHARVPRPMGMDFQMLPADTAMPLPSSRYAKDSTKGRLNDRILNGKKKASDQAVTLSVEGRNIDRL